MGTESNGFGRHEERREIGNQKEVCTSQSVERSGVESAKGAAH